METKGAQFRNILLVIRGQKHEKAAIERAVKLAEQNGAKLTALRVLTTLPHEIRMFAAALPAQDLETLAKDSAHSELSSALRQAQKRYPQLQIRVVSGRPFVEVIHEVKRRKHDLVILSASLKNSLRTKLVGSMTMRLMRTCPCSIWVVKPERRTARPRIVAAVSPEFESTESIALNRKILDTAARLAQKEDGELHVVHAWNVFSENAVRARAGIPQEIIKQVRHETRIAQGKWLEELFAPYDREQTKGRMHLVNGRPDIVILRLLTRLRADTLVMGTVCRTGFSNLLIGNTAERILSQVGCSVLTVKPDGFVTPIK